MAIYATELNCLLVRCEKGVVLVQSEKEERVFWIDCVALAVNRKLVKGKRKNVLFPRFFAIELVLLSCDENNWLLEVLAFDYKLNGQRDLVFGINMIGSHRADINFPTFPFIDVFVSTVRPDVEA
jgi:hypothetical protein